MQSPEAARGGDRHVGRMKPSLNISCARPDRNFYGLHYYWQVFSLFWRLLRTRLPSPFALSSQGFLPSLAAPFLFSFLALYYFLTSTSIWGAMCSGGGGGGHE